MHLSPAPRFAILKACVYALAVGCFAFCAGPAKAENKDLQVSLSQKGIWDSNPLMLTGNHDAIFGSLTTPKITFKSKTPTTQFNASAFIDENIFDKSDYNSTDYHGALGLSKKNERWEAGIDGNVNYDTTRTSELTTLGSNVASVRHLGYSTNPYISFLPTQVDKISVAGSFLKSQYESSAHTDYHVFSVNPSYTHNFTPLNAGIFSFNAQRYQTEESSDEKVDSLGPSLGWITSITPEFSAKVLAGTQISKQTDADGVEKDWKWNSTFSAEVNYKDEQDAAKLTATRKQQPYSNGNEYLLTTFALSETHNITPHFSVNGGVSYQYADDSGETGSNLENLLSANVGLTYKALEQVDITTSYKYKDEERTNSDKNARENVAMIGLVFHTSLDGM